jgi:hypothetical protein
MKRWLRKLSEKRNRTENIICNSRNLARALARMEVQAAHGSTLQDLSFPGSVASSTTRLTTTICRQEFYRLDAYRYWIDSIGQQPTWHRKQWEYFFILQALYERGMLAAGKRGLGFGVGREPLPAVMAALGATVVASDAPAKQARASGWRESSLAAINANGVCDTEKFARLVSYVDVDMRNIPQDLPSSDFVWSTCALEHLGSLEAGLKFVLESSKRLKIGGVGVHTTEYNLSSEDRTIERGPTVLYRRQDMDRLAALLKAQGCELLPFDAAAGDGVLDGFVDLPPFAGGPHLRLKHKQYTITSLGLIVERQA